MHRNAAEARRSPVVPGMAGLAGCTTYDIETVKYALRKALAPFGGMPAFVAPGERIALKPNLLLGAAPEKAITTHPAVLEAVAGEVREAGAHCFVVESPGAGIPHVERYLRRTYARTGLLELAERTGLELNYDASSRPVSFPEGALVKRFDVIAPLLDADGIISLPKLKTHTFMVYTGGVKNLFGAVPGFEKPGFHARLPEKQQFADMLLDIVAFLQPRLHVMDAVLALEGNGPGTGGSPRHVGALLASHDPVALDAICCRLAGIAPLEVPVLERAFDRGLWSGSADDVAIAGEAPDELAVEDFRLPEGTPASSGFGGSVVARRVFRPLVRDALTPRPRPQSDRCTACRKCELSCPVGAIGIVDRLARVEDGSCIRCYCCHEVCPEAAVDMEYSMLGRTIRALFRRAERAASASGHGST